MRNVRLILVGDHSESIPAHRAPRALELASRAAECVVDSNWVSTPDVTTEKLQAYDGVWLVPGSPYVSMDGALSAVKYARERRVPSSEPAAGFNTR